MAEPFRGAELRLALDAARVFGGAEVQRWVATVQDLEYRVLAAERERDTVGSEVNRLTAKVAAMEEGAAELPQRAEAAEAERDAAAEEADALRQALVRYTALDGGRDRLEGCDCERCRTALAALDRRRSRYTAIAAARREIEDAAATAREQAIVPDDGGRWVEVPMTQWGVLCNALDRARALEQGPKEVRP